MIHHYSWFQGQQQPHWAGLGPPYSRIRLLEASWMTCHWIDIIIVTRLFSAMWCFYHMDMGVLEPVWLLTLLSRCRKGKRLLSWCSSKKCLFSWLVRKSFAEERLWKMSRRGNGHLQRIITVRGNWNWNTFFHFQFFCIRYFPAPNRSPKLKTSLSLSTSFFWWKLEHVFPSRKLKIETDLHHPFCEME
jgi:hypothetical protein